MFAGNAHVPLPLHPRIQNYGVSITDGHVRTRRAQVHARGVESRGCCAILRLAHPWPLADPVSRTMVSFDFWSERSDRALP